ncbi:MAG: hypothetical protein ABEH47_05015 [Haloferacaceae archaeon]
MSGGPALDALRAALADWRRHVGAVALVALGFVVAAALGTPAAQYGAYLFAFVVWMGWFVLTCVAWIERAEF